MGVNKRHAAKPPRDIEQQAWAWDWAWGERGRGVGVLGRSVGTRHSLPVRARPYTPRKERWAAHSLSVPKQKATKDCNADDSRSGHSEGM